MKKTTTRLATTTAVLVMTAFAILLAQHDARKTSQIEDSITTSKRVATEPPMPLALEDLGGGPHVVRGNNDGAIDDRMTAYDNPLREDQFADTTNSLASLGSELLGAEVVPASGESYAEPMPNYQTGASNSAPQLQPLPAALPDNFPPLGNSSGFPVGLPSTSNSSNSAASAKLSDNAPGAVPNLSGSAGQSTANTFNAATPNLSNLPGTSAATNAGSTRAISGSAATASGGLGQAASGSAASGSAAPGTARLGTPTAPPPAVNGSNPSGVNNRTASASMSDTQRGAMVPTQLSDAGIPSLNAGQTSGMSSQANFGQSNTAFAGTQPNLSQSNQAQLSSSQGNPAWNNSVGGSSSSASLSDSASNAWMGGASFSDGQLPNGSSLGNSGAPSSASSLGSSGSLGGGSMAPLHSPPAASPAGLPPSSAVGFPNTNQSVGSGTSRDFNGSRDYNNPPAMNNSPARLNSPSGAGAGFGGAMPAVQQGFADSSSVGPKATLVSNQPGSRVLDGSQNPFMQIQKRAPEEITVGKKASFAIIVRNAGNSTAHDVTVVDRVPRGSRFAEASPGVTPTADGVLVWKLGEMGPGDEKTINLQIIPEVEGEIGSVASVHIAAQASARSMATSPQIELQVDGAAPVIIGQGQEVTVTLRNTGTGVARGIRLEADIPNQLKHESGEMQLEAMLGDIRPGESKRLSLNVAAIQPGQSVCPLRAVNEDGVQAQGQFAVDVRAPQLVATIAGPAKRYLERQATYQIVVNNNGTAMARNLYFDVHLPVGLKFVSADIAQASYHPETHSVTLGLAELNAGANATFTVTVLPVELGPQNIRFNASGDLGVTAEAKGQMVVEGLSELAFTIGQDNGTVEVGATTTYAVQVSNVGNQSDKNVQLQIQLPDGAKLVKVDAPVDYREEAGRLVFAAVGEMRSRDVKTFRFQVQHQRAGNQVVRAQLTSANWPVAVLKEEGTLVYNDQ